MRALLLLGLALLLAVPADAQRLRILDRARQAVENAAGHRQPETPQVPSAQAASETAQTTPDTASADDGPMPPTGPFPRTAAGHAPAIDLHNWLRALGDLHAEQDGSTVEVRPFGNQIVLPVEGVTYQNVLRRADGTLVTWEEVELETEPEFPAFGTLEGDDSYGLKVELETGSYRASVTANGHEIGALPFEIVRTTTGDGLYDTRSVFGIRGPWNDLAVLVLDEGKGRREYAEQSPVALYFRLPLSMHGEQGGRYRATLYRGSTVLNDDDWASVANPGHGWWLRRVALSAPSGYLRERLVADGDYRIEVAEEGRPPVRVYRFRVLGGEVVAHEQSRLDTMPRADFLTPQSLSAMRNSNNGTWSNLQDRPGSLLWLEAN